MTEHITLSNGELELELSAETGKIIGFKQTHGDTQLIHDGRLAGNFRLLVPTETTHNNYVEGHRQPLSSIARNGHSEITLTWDHVVGEQSGLLEIRVILCIRLHPTKPEASFQLELENNSNYRIEEVWLCPISGTHGLASRHDTRVYMSVPTWNTLPLSFFGLFQSDLSQYFGTTRPRFWIPYPNLLSMQWLCLSDDDQSFYFGYHDPSGDTTWFHFELWPHLGSINNWNLGEWPDLHDLPTDQPAGVQIAAIKLPYLEPGDKYQSAELICAFQDGTWHRCADRYRSWCDSWMRFLPRPNWILQCDAWLSIQMLTPDDSIYFTYRDLPDLAREAKEYGVEALHVVGWNRLGQDRADPDHTIDPRLGTKQEFMEAIQACEEMGVRVILFSKFIWADMTESWTRDTLKWFAVTDPYGIPYVHPGAGYQTIAGLTHHSSRPNLMMCHNHHEYQELALKEMAKIRSFGCSATQYDQNQAHFRQYCFDQRHGHRYGVCTSAGNIELARRFALENTKHNSHFALMGENLSDTLGQYYMTSYGRLWQLKYTPMLRYTFPEIGNTDCIVGLQDRNALNQCILLGYIANFEFMNFKGRMQDGGSLADYGRELLKLRKELKAWLWFGRFRDTLDVTLTQCKGEIDDVAYARYEHRTTGQPAIVITNYGRNPVTVSIEALTGSVGCSLYRPGVQPTHHPTWRDMDIQGESLIVLVADPA